MCISFDNAINKLTSGTPTLCLQAFVMHCNSVWSCHAFHFCDYTNFLPLEFSDFPFPSVLWLFVSASCIGISVFKSDSLLLFPTLEVIPYTKCVNPQWTCCAITLLSIVSLLGSLTCSDRFQWCQGCSHVLIWICMQKMTQNESKSV